MKNLAKYLPPVLNAFFYSLVTLVFWAICGVFGLILGVASLYFF